MISESIMKTVCYTRFLTVFLCIVSCSKTTDKGMIDVRRALNKEISFSSLFSETEVVSLSDKDGVPMSFSDAILSVTEDGFVVTEKAAGIIRFFDRDGCELSKKFLTASIKDVYASCDELDVLSGCDVVRLSIPELGLISETHLPDSLHYEKIGKRYNDSFTHSDVVVISAYSACGEYFCELYLHDFSFHPCLSPFPIAQDEIAAVMSRSRFFTSASSGDLMFQYSDSGNIWRCASFMSPEYKWNVVNADCLGPWIVYEKAQMTCKYVFLSVRSDAGALTFVIDRNDNVASVLTNGEDSVLPIEVILSDCAYSLAPVGGISSGAAVVITHLEESL